MAPDAPTLGPRVGYLHGMIGTPAGAPFLAAAQSHGLELTSPSLPGFSGTAPHPDTRTIHDWVFHLSGLIDDHDLVGQPLVAVSVGAMVALELAALRPEAFSQLILISPLGLWDDAHPVADPFATTLTAQRQMLTVDIQTTAVFFDDPEDLEGDALIEYGVDRYLTRTAAASLVWPIPDHGLSQRIGRVHTPVTVVWGTEDRIVPAPYRDLWASALPEVTATQVVSGAGHLVDWDQPEAVAALVVDALR